ncbi:hypothetical protein ACLB2K_007361 [Fragaria x ananassa]
MMEFRGNTPVSFSVPQVADLATPKEKRLVSIREVPDFPSPSKITSAQRGREEEDDDDDGRKRARHSLVMVPMPLNPNELRFSVDADGILSIVRTGKSSKERGHPRGSKNKKPNLIENPDSMAPGSAVEEKAHAPESKEDLFPSATRKDPSPNPNRDSLKLTKKGTPMGLKPLFVERVTMGGVRKVPLLYFLSSLQDHSGIDRSAVVIGFKPNGVIPNFQKEKEKDAYSIFPRKMVIQHSLQIIHVLQQQS